MNTHTPTAPREMQAQVILGKLQALRPFLLSVMITLTGCFLSFMMVQTRLDWPNAQLIMGAILGLMALNFVMVGVLEPYRSTLGTLTIPAMLASIGMTVICLLMEVVNRFVVPLNYGVLTPIAVAAMVVIYASVFRERHTLMKLFLSINGLALTVLWCLGNADKMALPF